MKPWRAVLVVAAVLLGGCAPPPGVRTGSELATRSGADAAYAMGNTTAALSAYRQLVAQGVNDAVVWTRIGNLELLQNKPHQAADAYDKAVQLDPMDTEAWHNMAIIRLRQAAAMLDQERASLKADDPRAAEVRCQQARIAALLHAPDAEQAGCNP